MKHVNIGLKFGPAVTKQHVDAVKSSVDFIELYAERGYEYEVLDGIDKPVILHVPHAGSGTNIANPAKRDVNVDTLQHVLRLADKFDAKKIIFHPELYEDDYCTIEVLLDFLQEFYDPRLHVENMPYNSLGIRHMGATPEEIKRIMDGGKVKLCLDLPHATEYLTRTRQDLGMLESFISLRPNHYHMTDTDLTQVFDDDYDEIHVNFGQGTLGIERLLSYVPDGSELTIETPQDTKKNLAELQTARRIFNEAP